MSAFPGRIYDGDGVSTDGLPGDLTQDQIDACDGRSLVTAGGLAPVAQVWLLDDDATWSAVPQSMRDSAVALVEAGQSIVILSRRREAEIDVRDGLMDILPDGDAVPDRTEGQA